MKGFRSTVVAVASATALVASACGGDADDAPPPPSGPVVEITGMAYSPNVITVDVGDTVTWNFDDRGRAHDVVGVGGEAAFLRSPLQATGTWAHTFTEPGTFEYTCTPHPDMRGTVIVR
ncbi:copper-binding protein [Rhodococcus triatomae]|uniref:Plastocyanin n=1 Tax=Rhodococcus triatomae TaxID=300028 RepID=A0A1G8R6P2_9NOCA|nr:plastocyanin/azurin family copper-binding protein [Rhodococcus triatomae]QNG19580.1 copper-binding protein [Rhodococcus triatomae]QNG24505.1 copper-binding protein [Rhodococcus triatomae]SDJ12245.1 Plastocyanin [Rhodococcus triatomae]